MSGAVVVTGVGGVCGGRRGREGLLAALETAAAAPTPEIALDAHLENARAFRRVADASRFALAAVADAVADAGFASRDFGGERVGLVLGITHGAAPYSVEFHRVVLLEGPLAASPTHFSESVPNAAAGNVAMAFDLRGPVHTLVGEEPVGTQAIAVAAELLLAGVADRCVVAGTEERSEVIASAYAQVDRAAGRRGPLAPPPLTAGAAALVLELAETATARGARRLARLEGWGLSRASDPCIRETVVTAFRRAAPAVRPDHVLLPTGRHREAARASLGDGGDLLDLAPGLGNPAGAANLLQVGASVALLAAGKYVGPGLVLAAGVEGTVSALAVAAGREAVP